MTTVIVDYESGNLHSAEKAFQRMARETGGGEVIVTSDPDKIRRADRIVLPGDGAFPACRRELYDHRGVYEAIEEAVIGRGRPFLGICIGMQMLATRGMEYQETPGFDWIGGTVEAIRPADPALKVPHMGCNDLVIFHFRVDDPAHLLAHAEYGAPVTAVVGRDTIVGTQFHPEKSQATGLRLIANYLAWRP